MKSGYESLVWINDKNGKEYVCSLENSTTTKSFDQLSEAEKAECANVSLIVGTERW